MKHHVRFSVGLVAGLLMLVVATSAFAASFKENLARVPGDANVLILINAGKARQSAFAQRLRRDDPAATHLDQSILSAPNVDLVVTAARLDMESRTPLWELGVISTKEAIRMPKLATFLGGTMDTLDDLPAIRLPINAYIVQLAPRLAAVRAPGDRQSTSRWIRQTKIPGETALPEYLKEMAVFPETVGTEVIMAIDLDDVIGFAKAREYLSRSKAVAGKQVDIDELSRLLASIRGTTLGVRIVDAPVGKLRIDFGQDASALAPVAKPLILEILANLGATIDEFEDWTAEVKGKTMYLGGTFSINGLRRVLSLAEPPLPPLEDQSVAQAKKTPPQDRTGEVTSSSEASDTAVASLKYFKAVSDILDDVGPRRKRGDRGPTQYGLWLNRYARKIDKLSILNVDKDLLNYGMNVSGSLRQVSSQYQNVGVQASVQSTDRASNYYPMAVGYYGQTYGYYEPHGLSDRKIAMKEGTAQAVGSGMTVFDQLDDATIQIRRLMTERYGLEF
jgi:hypothetical protein